LITLTRFFLSYDTRGLECDKAHTLAVIVISGAHFIIGSMIMLSIGVGDQFSEDWLAIQWKALIVIS
jgi:hypothetical protein